MFALTAGNQQVNMVEFAEENPQFSPGLLSFALEYLLANKWPSNSLMEDYNTCDAECDIDQAEPCGCTCNTNPFEWTDDEVCVSFWLLLRLLRGWERLLMLFFAVGARNGRVSVLVAVEEKAIS